MFLVLVSHIYQLLIDAVIFYVHLANGKHRIFQKPKLK